MKEKIMHKLDEHINHLLGKPELTNEEYGILRDRMREIKFAEEEAARRLEWEKQFMPMLETIFKPPVGGGFCAQ